MNKEKEEEINKIEKMDAYLKSREEIFDFIISRKTFNHLLTWFSIFAAILFIMGLFGGKVLLNHIVKKNIDKKISEKIDEEYLYLSERNKITELGDLAITSNNVEYFKKLKNTASSQKSDRVRTAVEAEILRIASFLSTWGYSGFIEEIKENELSTEQLFEMYKNNKDLNTRITILLYLSHRYHKNTPEFLLNIANTTDHLRLRYLSLGSLQVLLDDFSTNCLDYDSNYKLWLKNKEKYQKKIAKLNKNKK